MQIKKIVRSETTVTYLAGKRQSVEEFVHDLERIIRGDRNVPEYKMRKQKDVIIKAVVTIGFDAIARIRNSWEASSYMDRLETLISTAVLKVHNERKFGFDYSDVDSRREICEQAKDKIRKFCFENVKILDVNVECVL